MVQLTISLDLVSHTSVSSCDEYAALSHSGFAVSLRVHSQRALLTLLFVAPTNDRSA